MATLPSKIFLAACLCAAPGFPAKLLFNSDPAQLPVKAWQGNAASYLLAPAPYDSVLGNRIMASQGMLQDTTLRQIKGSQRKMLKGKKPSNPDLISQIPVDSQFFPLEPGTVLFRTAKATFLFSPRTSEYLYSRPELLAPRKSLNPNGIFGDSALKARADVHLKTLLGSRAPQYLFSNMDSEFSQVFDKRLKADSGWEISVGRHFRYLLLKDNRAILSNSAHARLGLAMDGRVVFFSVLMPSLRPMLPKPIRGNWNIAVSELHAYAHSRDKVRGPNSAYDSLRTVAPVKFQPSLVLIKDVKPTNFKKSTNPYANMRLAPAMTIICRNRTGNNSEYLGFVHLSQENGKRFQDIP